MPVRTILSEKKLQKALLLYWDPAHQDLAREALRRAGRSDLVGHGPRALVPPAARAKDPVARARDRIDRAAPSGGPAHGVHERGSGPRGPRRGRSDEAAPRPARTQEATRGRR